MHGSRSADDDEENEMKLFRKAKDGGPKSTVTGYWLIEWKGLFSVTLLKFKDGSRDEYHSHAFDSVSWLLKGCLVEQHLNGAEQEHRPSLVPVVTRRTTFHRVLSKGTTWALTFRGPWSDMWLEFDPRSHEFTTLAHGRKKVG